MTIQKALEIQATLNRSTDPAQAAADFAEMMRGHFPELPYATEQYDEAEAVLYDAGLSVSPPFGCEEAPGSAVAWLEMKWVGGKSRAQ